MKSVFALFALCIAAAAYAEGEPAKIDLSGLDSSKAIAGTTAAGTPAAYKDRGAVYAFNGAGMSGNTHGTTADNAMYALSSNKSGAFPWYIQVDLSAPKRIVGVRLYNYNFAANGKTYTERGVSNFTIYASMAKKWCTSASSIEEFYTLAYRGVLDKAPGTADYEGQYFAFETPVDACFLALVAEDDYDYSTSHLNYNGISEIQIFSSGEVVNPKRVIYPVIVDNADATSVTTSGVWKVSNHNSDRFGANYLHNDKAAAEDLWVRFTPEILADSVYRVSLFWNGDNTRGTAVPVEIVYAGGVTTNYVDMTKKSSTWNVIGSWPFKEGKSGSVRIMTLGQDGKTVIADAVRFDPWTGFNFIVR